MVSRGVLGAEQKLFEQSCIFVHFLIKKGAYFHLTGSNHTGHPVYFRTPRPESRRGHQ